MTPRGIRRQRGASRLLLAVVLGLALTGSNGGGAARADDAADARRHAQRAASLAASGKCKQAVAELDKALAVLRDPALLFNRGECHRKLGDSEAALEDYKQFLADLPKAPNRVEVQRRITELSRKTAATGAAPAAAPKDDRSPRALAPAGRDGVEPRSTRPDSPVTKRQPAPAPPPPSEPKPAAPRGIVLTPPSPDDDAERPVRGRPALSVAASPSEPAPDSGAEDGIASKPWFWIAVAVAAVGAGVGAFVLLNHDSTTVPPSALGNYKF